jgi:hypothetical protein
MNTRTCFIPRILRPVGSPSTTRRTVALGLAALAMLIGFGASPAHAETVCIGSVPELLSAIAAAKAGPEGSDWALRLRPGTYAPTTTLDLTMSGDRDNKEISISGGWNADCSAQTPLPISTTIKGIPADPDGTGGTSINISGDNESVLITGLRIESFNGLSIIDDYCPPFEFCPDTRGIYLQYNELVDMRRVGVYAQDANNFLFRNNRVTGVREFEFNYANDELPPVFSFNTIVSACSGGGSIKLRTERSFDAHHNIFRGCGPDLEISAQTGFPFGTPKPVSLRANLFGSAEGLISGNPANPEFGNVFSNAPGFVDAAAGNYRLAAGSPAINAGYSLIQMGVHGLEAPVYSHPGPSVDLDHAPRLRGTRYDIGAYESTVNNGAPAFLTVTTNADSGPGSLRAAIQAANSAAGTPQTIAFNIPGSCPQVIALASPLPDVTDTLVIDGYSKAANAAWPAAPNTAEVGSNASVCVVLTPVTAITHAFQVPTGQPAGTSLVLRGLAFGSGLANYTQAPVQLRAGTNHRVEGNYFGGTGPAGLGNLGALPGALLIRGTAQSVQVGGGDDPVGNRNVFGRINVNATSNVIIMNDATSGGHVIEGNLFGLMANGLNVEPIGNNAISASSVPGVEVRGNVIAAATGSAVFVSGAEATGWTIVGNRIGVNQIGIGTPASGHGNGTGILVSNGSGEHDIGVLAGLSDGQYSNEIRNSQGPGVWINATAGSGTSVAGNRVFANGLGGSGLAVDLGALGPTPNDPGDGDTGPNGLQNAPVVVSSASSGSERSIAWTLNSVPNAPFKLHVYRSVACPGGGSTGAELNSYIGTIDTSTNGSGNASGSATVSGVGAPGFITMTATLLPAGSTSEPSACFAEPAAGADAVFSDSFE